MPFAFSRGGRKQPRICPLLLRCEVLFMSRFHLAVTCCEYRLPCLLPWLTRSTCNVIPYPTWPSEHRGDEQDLEGGPGQDGSCSCTHEDGRVEARSNDLQQNY